MKKEEVKMIIILLLITVLVIGGLRLWKNSKNEDEGNKNKVVTQNEHAQEEFVQKLEDGSKLNISDKLLSTKQLDGLEITNIQLKETGGITTLLANVENKTGQAVQEKMVKVEILDKSGNVITTLRGIIDSMSVGESVQLNIAVTADVANAYDFRISSM